MSGSRRRPDDGLRALFHSNMRAIHWVPVETGMTMTGVPDSNGCLNGVDFWVEYKSCQEGSNRIPWKRERAAFQIAWHERRRRSGGRTFLAVKRGGELHLYMGNQIRLVYESGLSVHPILFYSGGPRQWDWKYIQRVLVQN